MKKIFTKILCAFAALFLLVGISAPAFAQYTATTLASNVGLSAIAKDSHGNTYVIENPNQGNTNRTTSGEIVEYTNGTGSGTVIYNGPYIADNDFGYSQDYAFGIVVDSNNNIYFSTSNGQQYAYGEIIKLTYTGGSPFNPIASNYSAAPYITSVFNGTIAYPTGMAIDASNNLYVLQYDANDGTNNYGAYTVAKYAAGNTTTYTEIYKGLELYNTATSGTAICALAVDPVSGNVYVADWYDYLNGETYAGFIEKLTYSSGSYTASTLYNNYAYCQALACDASGNLYANIGSGNDQETTVKTVEFVGGSGSPVTLYSGLRGDQDYWCYGMAVIGTTIFTGEGNQNVAYQEGYYMELTAPSINSITANNAYTNAGSETFTVTFSAAITGVTASNFSLTTSGVSGTSIGTPTTSNNITWSVPVNTGSGSGTIGLNLANTTGLEYALSNTLPYTGGTTTVDKTAPTINIGSPSASSIITGTGSVTYTVTYSDANFNSSTLATGNITLNSTGGASGTIGVSGSGTTRTVTISGITGTGTLGISIAAGTASDLAGNAAPAAGPSTTFSVVQPTITVPGGTTTIPSTTSGTPGASTSFNISAANLTPASGSLTVTAPANVQVSPDGSTWNSSYSQSYSSNTLGSTPVYVRLAGTGTLGTISGNVSVSGGGANTVNQAVSGTLNAASTTISSLAAVSSTTTNAASVQYTATFAASVSGLSATDFTLNTTGVTGASVGTVSGSGTSWTVTVNTGSGSGTIQLLMNSSSGVTPSVSNASSGSPFAGTTYTIDKTAPTVTLSAPSVSYANSSTTVSFTATWSDANLNTSSISLNPAMFTYGGSGYSLNVGNINITGSGATRTISFTGISGDGTFNFTIPAGSASDNAGNSAGVSNTTSSVTIDNTAPTVAVGAPSKTLTNTGPVTYDVSYSDANFNSSTLSAGNVTLNSTGGASASVAVTKNSNTDYTVTLSGITGNGTLGITIQAGTATDLAGNTAAASSPSATFTVNNTPPTVSSINAASPSNINPTNATSVTYTVTFSEAVTGVDATDFTVTTSGTTGSVTNVSGSGTTYAVTVGSISGNGTLRLDLNNTGDPITDAAGNQLTTGFTSGSVYTIDNTPPTLTSGSYFSNNSNSSQYAKVGDVITLSAGYNEQLQSATMTIGGNTVPVSFSNNNQSLTGTYTMTSGDTEGNVPWTISVTDLAGNVTNHSNTDYGTVLIFDKTPPLVTISAPSAAAVTDNGTASVTYTISYSDANFASSTLSNSDITLNTTGTAAGTTAVSGSGMSYTVTISNITGVGTLGISVGPNTAQDTPGNLAPAAGPSATFNVFNNDDALAGLTLSNGTLSPGFSSTTTSYTAAVGYGLSSILITPTTHDPNATVTINGNAAQSGQPTAVSLVVGTNNVTIVVTAQDGTTQKTYNITITEAQSYNNNLASVKTSAGLAQGATVPSTLTESVVNSVTSLTVTPTVADPTATVTVNGAAVTSGQASGSINLNVGPNTITMVVTAQDGKTQTYTLTVTRAASANDKLSNLAVNSGTLSPAFGTATNYLDYVANGIAFTVTATVADPTATLTINGSAATSGAATAVPLTVGNNTVTIVVTAQNTTATKTYTLVVNEARSPNSTLYSLTTSGGFSQGQTVPTTLTESVPNATSSIIVTPTMADPNATVTVNGTAVTSGSASNAINLNVGQNTITIVGTAQNGNTTTYTLTVTRAASSLLTNIAATAGTLTPAFASATTSYAIYAVAGTTSTTITPTAIDPNATITVNGTTVASGTASPSITTPTGNTTVTVAVTAADNSTTTTYTVVVNVARSPNSTLYSLTTSGGFSQGQTVPTTLTESVPNATSSITVTPTMADPNATVTVNGTAVTSGSASNAINLNVGQNTITIVGTAQNGNTTTYTLTVTRAASSLLTNIAATAGSLNPAFASTTTGYAIYAVAGTTSTTITPTAVDPNATITVNGTTVASGSASAAIPLTVGNTNVTVAVTAADNSTTTTYTVGINVARSPNNTLYSLATSAGLSQGQTVPTTLTESVPYGTSSITVTPTTADPNATVTVNSTAVNSGTASSPITLSVGANTITIIVTAQNGNTLTYTLTVTRAPGSTLNSLALSAGTLSPTFASITTAYSAAVGNGTSSITVTPTASDPNATIKVNGTTVASGTASSSIPLAVGNTTITVAVTAADNSSTTTYTVGVNRARSSNDALTSFKTSGGLAKGVPVPTTLTESVVNAASTITITPTVQDATATVTVDGTAVTSGTASASIPLAVGPNTITTVVTAQNGATQTYTLTVTRAAGSMNTVYQPVSVSTNPGDIQLADDGINVHQGVSPNGDGINDYLQIDNITNYPDNNLKIMNRNGLLVYEAKGYDNATKAFDGHSNKNGQMQLPGTYFYELDYTANGITKHKTGYLVLKY